MARSKKTAVIEEVTNTHDQLMRWKQTELQYRPVAIIAAYGTGRTTYRDGWAVYSPWTKTDPEAHWADYGRKRFSDTEGKGTTTLERRKSALKLAMDWADKNYGPFEWERNRSGDYVPAPLNSKFPIRKN